MNTTPPGSGDCCLSQRDGLTYIKIGPRAVMVGMLGLEAIFQELYAAGRHPEAVTDAELVDAARRSNWIAQKESVELDYATGLRQAYAAYWNRREKKAKP